MWARAAASGHWFSKFPNFEISQEKMQKVLYASYRDPEEVYVELKQLLARGPCDVNAPAIFFPMEHALGVAVRLTPAEKAVPIVKMLLEVGG